MANNEFFDPKTGERGWLNPNYKPSSVALTDTQSQPIRPSWVLHWDELRATDRRGSYRAAHERGPLRDGMKEFFWMGALTDTPVVCDLWEMPDEWFCPHRFLRPGKVEGRGGFCEAEFCKDELV